MLILAVTIHNIPEGLAVGVAFGAVAAGLPTASITSALALAIGIGIQNLPEGLAISMPLRKEGLSRVKVSGMDSCPVLLSPYFVCWVSTPFSSSALFYLIHSLLQQVL